MRRRAGLLALIAALWSGSAATAPAQEGVAPESPELQQELPAPPTLEQVDAAQALLSDDERDLVERERLDVVRDLLEDAKEQRLELARLEAELERERSVAPAPTPSDQAPYTGPQLVEKVGLEEAQDRLDSTRAKIASLQAEIEALEERVATDSASRASLPGRLALAEGRVEEALEALRVATGQDEELGQLRRWELSAELEAARASAQRLEVEDRVLDALEPMLDLRLAGKRRALEERRVDEGFFEKRLDESQEEETRAETAVAETLEDVYAGVSSALGAYQGATAARFGELESAKSSGMRLERALEGIAAQQRDLATRADDLRSELGVSGLTDGNGDLLRNEYKGLLKLNDDLPRRAGARAAYAESKRAVAELKVQAPSSDPVLRERWREAARAELAASVASERAEAGGSLEDVTELDGETLTVSQLVDRAVDDREEVLIELLRERKLLAASQLDHLQRVERVRAVFDDYLALVSGEALWFPSVDVAWPDYPDELAGATRWLIGAERRHDGRSWWLEAPGRMLGELASPTPRELFGGLAVLVLLAARGRIRRRLGELEQLIRSYRTDAFKHTLEAVALTVLLGTPLAIAFWAGTEWLELSAEAGKGTLKIEQLAAQASAIERMTPIVLALGLLRALAVKGGLGEVHLRWSPEAVALVRTRAAALETIVVPSGLVYHAFSEASAGYSDTFGRIAFLVAMGALAVFAHVVLHPTRGVLSESFSRNPDGLLQRNRRAWYTLGVAVPLVYLVLAGTGYYFTALELTLRLELTIALILVLVVINGLLQRWLFVTRRRLAVEQARKRARERREGTQDERVGEDGMRIVDEDEVDIPALDAQTRQLFRSGVSIGTLVGLYLIWASALPALGGLERVQVYPTLALVESQRLGDLDRQIEALRDVPAPAVEASSPAPEATADDAEPTAVDELTREVRELRRELSALREEGSGSGSTGTGSSSSRPSITPGIATTPGLSRVEADEARVTLADVALALIVLGIAGVLGRNIPALLEISLLQRLPLDSGARYAFTTLVRYAILLLGASSAFGALGIGWDKVQWLVAALTFGLAFGLQEIFANFVSGVIILLERPVRIGDIVTVAGTEGRVTRLRMRATTIMDWDRRELLVPNKEFITGSIVNWTLSDPVTRIRLDVGVAYGSDVAKARELLLACADDCEWVLDDPAPRAWFVGFGDSTLDLRLLCFIATRDNYFLALDELHRQTDRRFKEAEIEIAFPQRDLHIRSAPGLEELRSPNDDDSAQGESRT